jgi:hypothetical protein
MRHLRKSIWGQFVEYSQPTLLLAKNFCRAVAALKYVFNPTEIPKQLAIICLAVSFLPGYIGY